METREWRDIIPKEKKAEWPEGEWQTEPDKIQWQDPKTNLPCLIVRNSLGTLCGYVGVTKGHPYFEKHYRECECNVHGELTFSDFCSGDEHGICHVVEEDDRTWWLGFDCGHYLDICPGAMEFLIKYGLREIDFPGATYKNIDYVKRECRLLAEQLAKRGVTQAV